MHIVRVYTWPWGVEVGIKARWDKYLIELLFGLSKESEERAKDLADFLSQQCRSRGLATIVKSTPTGIKDFIYSQTKIKITSSSTSRALLSGRRWLSWLLEWLVWKIKL